MKLADTKKSILHIRQVSVLFTVFGSDVNAPLNMFKIPQKEAVVYSSTHEVSVKAHILTAQH